MNEQVRVKADVNTTDTSPFSFAAALDSETTISMVKEAIHEKRLALAYQPIITSAAKGNRICFYEGLIRVLHPSGYAISAQNFMSQIEPLEMGREIDCHSLAMGLKALAMYPTLRLSINMSARSIGYPKWLQILHNGIVNTPGLGDRLVLEISENSAIFISDVLTAFMKEWQRHGVSFAMDDFGAGLSAIRYFNDFSFDIVKIDGKFTKGIARNSGNQTVTAALIAVAKQFGLATVAEQVENQADAQLLSSLGVDLLQGNFFAEASVTPSWLKKPSKQATA